MKTVRHKILVLSGKGGVGKSTFSAHLAHGLAEDETKQVGGSFSPYSNLVRQQVPLSIAECFLCMSLAQSPIW